MPLSNYRHGFPNKVTIREFPIMEMQNGNGNVFWVDSNKGSNGNKGTFDRPFATLDYAIGRCTANQGDKIFLAANHAETIIAAGTITADVAGIQIIGLGTSDDRPTVTATTDAAATFLVSADDVYIANIKFACNITSQVTMLDCNAARTIVDRCRFEEGTQTGLTFIDVNGGAANACDGVEIRGCEFYAPTAGNMNAAIELGEVADNIKILTNSIYGDFDDAGIHNPTGKTLTNMSIENNVIANLLTGQHAIELVSACTGVCVDNRLYGDTEAAILDPGSLKCINNQAVDGTDVGSFQVPYRADNLGKYIGINSADNDAATNLVVANADGSVLERLEDLRIKENREAGIAYVGVCDTGMGASATTIVSANFIGMGDDYFNTKYYMQVIKNTNSVGNAPEMQVRQITDFVSATGTFTVAAFGANVEEGDSIMVMHEVLITLGRDDADNAFDSSTVVANGDGSVLERLEYLQSIESGLNFTGTCDAGMTGSRTTIVCADLAGYGDDFFNTKYFMQCILNANSVGAAPEPEICQITDYVSSTGTFTLNGAGFSVNAEENDKVLLIHESLASLGRDSVYVNGYTSASVEPLADGSVLERLEYLQDELIPDILGLSMTGACDSGMTGSTTNIFSDEIKGHSSNALNNKYYMQVIKNANSIGNAPETQVRKITAYNGATGEFTTDAFSVNVEENDEILVLHESLVALGRDDNNNVLDSSNVVANADGSILERLEYLQAAHTQSGTDLMIEKTLTSSDILTTGVDITGVSSGGALEVIGLTCNTDATGLAGGTNFQITSDNANGETIIFEETVANLGANQTENLGSGSVVGRYGIVLETGKKLIAVSTVGDCTGAGTIDITIRFKRVADGATIAAA